MALGYYSNFPPNPHFIQNFTSTISSRQLQRKIIQQLISINRKELSFEEVSIPTIPDAVIIFEFGLAEEGDFNFLSEAEAERALVYLGVHQVQVLDFFCSIRYYKSICEGRQALKFDYFMLRLAFGKGMFEVQLFHERGPLYLSAKDITEFIIKCLNRQSKKAFLKEATR